MEFGIFVLCSFLDWVSGVSGGEEEDQSGFLGNWLPTPLPNSQFCPKWDVSVNVDLREG